MARQVSVLGISIGTRSMGIAILRGDVLMRWEMRSFPYTWSPEKLHAIVSAITDLITDHSPDLIAIRSPSAQHASIGLELLIKALQKLSTPKGVLIRFCSLTELKNHYSQKKRMSNRMLRDVTVKLYPELFREYEKEQHYTRPYYTKIFEAVMAARMCYSKRPEKNSSD